MLPEAEMQTKQGGTTNRMNWSSEDKQSLQFTPKVEGNVERKKKWRNPNKSQEGKNEGEREVPL